MRGEPSALYRYFPSRDALLTALITDAYEDLAAAVGAADAVLPRTELRQRWAEICRAVRKWALVHPAEYGLLYGNPIPGYEAPEETVEPAARVLLLLDEPTNHLSSALVEELEEALTRIPRRAGGGHPRLAHSQALPRHSARDP